MTDTLVEIFTRNLPFVSPSAAEDFARGMRAYHGAFQQHRDNALNYEGDPEYRQGLTEIMQLRQEDYWVYTPHFKRILGLSIGELFKTKITMITPRSDVDIFHEAILVDTHYNKWVVYITHKKSDPSIIHVALKFPRTGTKTHFASISYVSNMDKPETEKSTSTVFIVHDASVWHDSVSA
jgi:hypothetical protein